LIKREEFETLKTLLTPIAYIYIASWIILIILGMIVQCKIRKQEDKESPDAAYNYMKSK